MTHPGPIATTYVEIRPLPDSKRQFREELRAYEQLTGDMGRGVSQKLDKAISDGVRSGRLKAGQELDELDRRALKSLAASETIGRGIASTVTGLSRAVGAGVVTTLGVGLVHTRDYQSAVSQLEAGIRTSGASAGITRKEMESLANSVQKYSGQSDDSVIAAEAQLLMFSRVNNTVGQGADIFTRATKASADLAQRMGGDAASKAQVLGRALQDPAKNLSQLTQLNVTFTAAQTKTIKSLDESGRHLEAQKLILAQVEAQVGGSAKAYGQTLPGAIDRGRAAYNDFAGGAIKLADEHRTTSTVIAGTIATVYLAVKAVKAYREIRDTLYKGVAARIASNVAEARSIDAIAAAQTRAAGTGAVGGRAGAAAGAGRAAGGGVGAAAGAVGLASAVVGFAGVHSIGTVKTNQQVERLQRDLERAGATRAQIDEYELSLRDKLLGFDKDHLKQGQKLLDTLRARQVVDQHAAAVGPAVVAAEERARGSRASVASLEARRRDPRSLYNSGVIGGLFDELPSRSTGDIAGAREQAREAQRQVREALRDLTAARAGGRGASRGQIASAEASVLTARDALQKRGGNTEAEQLRLEAAEARLSDLRSKGGANADKVREAEDKLAAARRRSRDAVKDVEKAEKGTALGVGDIEKRVRGSLTNARTLVADEGLLIKKGIGENALVALQALEKSAPGTFDKVAKTMTEQQARALNSQYEELSKLQFEFADAPRVAGIRREIEANNKDEGGLWAALAQSQLDAYNKSLAAAGIPGGASLLTGPAPTRLPTRPNPRLPDPHEHGAPLPRLERLGVAGSTEVSPSVIRLHEDDLEGLKGARPVTLVLTGVRAQQIRELARSEAEAAIRRREREEIRHR